MRKNAIKKYHLLIHKNYNISTFTRNEGLDLRYLHQAGFGAAGPRGVGSERRRQAAVAREGPKPLP
jgi:hypothetical protein